MENTATTRRTRRCKRSTGQTYSDFDFGFAAAAIGIALTAGFGFAAILSAMMGFQISMGDWWTAMLQAHGHAQLLGWTGLFIAGVSLYFLPRLAGVPLRAPGLRPWALALLTSGIFLRTLAQPLLDAGLPPAPHLICRWGLGLSGVLTPTGVGLYLYLLLGTALRARPQRQAFHSVRPFLLMSVCGWVFYALLSSILTVWAAIHNTGLLPIAWNRFGVSLFLHLVLFPVAFAFSIRTFPLYLRLPAIRWSVPALAAVYLLAFILEHLPQLPDLLSIFPDRRESLRLIRGLGQTLKGGVILYLVWKLDLLLRLRPPWTINRILHPGSDRRPTREGLPDYGEFGRFEWLLYAAYAWLGLGAILESLGGIAPLAGFAPPADADAIRHIYLFGFISLLLFGMAPRMIPGFLHRRQVAHPGLVNLTFWIAGTASLCRILPLLLSGVLDRIPWGFPISSAAFGLSGILAWLAVALLGWNLWATKRSIDN